MKKRRLNWVPIVIVLVAIATGVYGTRNYWATYRAQKAQTDVAVKEMRATESKRADLLRQQARYDSAIGREEIARRNGYLRPDELPLKVPE